MVNIFNIILYRTHVILVPMAPTEIPPISETLLKARFDLQEELSTRTSSYDWLHNIQSLPRENFSELSRTVHITPTGGISICSNSMLSCLMYDSTLYFGTVKSWLIPTVEFSMLNPERCRRYVSIYCF